MGELIIYHSKCKDGFCAAWVASKVFPNAVFHAAGYGSEPPDVENKDVFILDFSYPPDDLIKMNYYANSLIVLDHHKTAQEALSNLPFAIFDMGQSGAGLTYRHLKKFVSAVNIHDYDKLEWVVGYVEDRDLWKFQLEDSRDVNSYISIIPLRFSAWDELVTIGRHTAAKYGKVVRQRTDQYVEEVSQHSRIVEFEGYNIPVVNASHMDISELVGALAEMNSFIPFAIGWWQRSDGKFQYSLRSRGDFDVSLVAKRYGGGGHKNAAGFVSDKLVF